MLVSELYGRKHPFARFVVRSLYFHVGRFLYVFAKRTTGLLKRLDIYSIKNADAQRVHTQADGMEDGKLITSMLCEMRKRSSQFISIEMSIVCVAAVCVLAFARCHCIQFYSFSFCVDSECASGAAVCNGRSSRSSAHTIVLFDAPTISMETARDTVKLAYRRFESPEDGEIILKTLFECVQRARARLTNKTSI